MSTDTEQVEEETAAPEEVITKDISKEKTTAPEAAPKAAAKASAAAGINEDPNLFERLDGYGRESKFYNNTDYSMKCMLHYVPRNTLNQVRRFGQSTLTRMEYMDHLIQML